MRVQTTAEQAETARIIEREIADFKLKVCRDERGLTGTGSTGETLSVEERVREIEAAFNALLESLVLVVRGLGTRIEMGISTAEKAATLAGRAHDCTQLLTEVSVTQFMTVAQALPEKGVMSTQNEVRVAFETAHSAMLERARAESVATGKPIATKVEYAGLITEQALQTVARNSRKSNRSWR